MKRKAIQMAGKTIVISLPSDWVKKFGIKKGDELELLEKNKKLEISIGRLTELKKILNLDLSNESDKIIKHTVSILHKIGFDELHIKYKNDSQFKILEEVINSMLLGYEILDKSQNTCLVKSITKIDEAELNNVIKKTFFVILECSRTFVEIIKNESFNKLDEIKDYELKNNKLTNYCHRIINKLHEEQGSELSYCYLILWELENVCDEFKYMANFFKTNPKGLKDFKEKLPLVIQTDRLINSYYDLFYKFNSVQLDEFINNCNSAQLSLQNNLNKKLSKEAYFLIFSLLAITTRLKSLVGSVMILDYLRKNN
ncbi:MAG: AbrB/MazE/SpoVT family DNA-binding domain-containing protein [Nanoarchaeota archaeon]|nr:AbrB/MazE/SpoVT family DNA-binding domain-containing protein [Nanoarchaeota archaeon]